MTAHRFCVAPMMEWTDRHCRAFHRTLTARARLYSEMVTTAALLHGDRARLIGFSALERPLVLQLGGSDPRALAACARIAADWGYDEVNLNCGCPSDRVQAGRFGACLMAEPELVGEALAAMRAATPLPVTVKCRIGIDDQDPDAALPRFVAAVEAAGVTTLIIHARKAWLMGLSPRENRDVPPLDYPRVYALKRARPHLTIVLNGGIATLAEAQGHLAHVDGVMLGRAAYQTPGLLLGVDPELFGAAPPHGDARAALEAFEAYVAARLAEGVPLAAMTRHLLGLFHGRPGARLFRRHLAETAHKPGAGLAVLRAARACLDAAPARAAA